MNTVLPSKSVDGIRSKLISFLSKPSYDWHFKKLGAKQVETVSAVYKENLDFPNHFYIYKQPEGVNPWYIGYGMDGPKGYSRNLDTIHTL